jgi:Phosphomannomutase
MDYRKNYKEWMNNLYFDAETKAELNTIALDEDEIKERFYKDLEFGTAGLRGIIGAGTNRMNTYTVRKATQGLANYILKKGKQEQGVAIAYDSRNMSVDFANVAALCLAANGIKAYVFESLRPTPVLSFAVRHLGAVAGINITASHNPPEYNGYKVYWEDGSQITPPHDTGIMNEVQAISDYAQTKTMDMLTAQTMGFYESIGGVIDDAYIAELKKLVLRPEAIEEMKNELKIVYTPLHGAGNVPVRRILRELGFTQVYVVKEQELPNGKFPTVSYPNPEAEEAFELALKLAKEVDADLVLATDPDADRLGVYAKDTKTGEYKVLTGNMSGCLLADYEIGQMKELGKLPQDGQLIKTIVTSAMAEAIASTYEVGLLDVLPGFKFIGQKILEFEKSGKGSFLFGFEESYGCLVGTHARDKDAVVATMALCEAAAYYRTKGKTLWDAMMDLYDREGYYLETTQSVTLSGIEGSEKIKMILKTLRTEPLKQIGDYKILRCRDYKTSKIIDLQTQEEMSTNLPVSEVLYYELEKNAWICVRPSGTEPKVKFYCGVRGKTYEDASQQSKEVGEAILKVIEKML